MNSSKRNICCVCLNAPNDFYGLWEFDSETVKWSTKLSYSVPEVEWLDHFLICMTCAKEVEKICVFKKLCLEAEKLRKSLLIKKKVPFIENAPTTIENTTEDVHVAQIATVSNVKTLQTNLKEEGLNLEENEVDPLTVVKVKVENTEIECELSQVQYEELRNKDEENIDSNIDPLIDETDVQLNDFDSDNAEEKHVNIENSCKQCNFNYKFKEELIEHLHTTHETYKCEFCQDTLLGSSNFINHISNTHQKETKNRIFRCFTCKHRFSSASDLYHHQGTHSYICNLCSKPFKTKGALNVHKKHRHLNSISNKKECVYFCKTCETHFSSYASLNLHNKAKHIDPETWKHTCNVCSRKFPAKQSYIIHMRRHLGVKPYACHLCSKSYVSNDDLNKHITAHKNGHPGKCYYCGDEYKKRREMEQHITKVHEVKRQPARSNRIKKCVCHMCNKGFYDNNQLSKHIRTHTGEKPFKCNECGKAFSDSANLGHHLQRMHNRTSKTNT